MSRLSPFITLMMIDVETFLAFVGHENIFAAGNGGSQIQMKVFSLD